MKFLKNLFAFLIPLLSMLITFSIFLLIDNVVDNYKSKISRDYSIIIVTNTPLEKDAIKELGGIKVERIQNLPNDKIITTIQSNLSESSIELLKQKLPNFYQIYLEIFPTTSELDSIKKTLLQNKNVKKVEVFYKNHNQIYLLLLLLNSVSFILFFIITIFAIIIIAKQIKLWFHEHNVKIAILRLHGASILYSASSILNYALLSSLLSFIISALFLFYVSNNMTVLFPLELHDIIDIKINLILELSKIFLLSFCISILRLHGASILYSASSILNYALLSSLLSFLIASTFLYYVSNNMTVLFPLELHDIVDIDINIFFELIKIFLLSFSISTFTIFGVLLKYKITND